MTPELKAKIRAEFEQAMEDWQAHGDWQFADREAAWKFFFLAGRASVLDGLEQVGYTYCYQGQDICFSTEPQDASIPDTLYWQEPMFRLTPELQEEKEKK